MRLMSGFPSITASAIAAHVPTFRTITPTSIGSFLTGTCRFATASISCFSPPCGYFVFRTRTDTPSRPFAAQRMLSIASGLLSSMAITPFFTFSARIAARRPSTTRPGDSSISRWSHVRCVSHSAPFTMIISHFCSDFRLSFTCVGKDAPPMPQMPASRIAGTIFAGSTDSTLPSG